MREQFKHLGPSNLASKPNPTKYQNVKIKSGKTSEPKKDGADDAPREESSVLNNLVSSGAIGGGVGAGLLASAGMEASDGTHALQTAYGGTDSSSRNNSKDKSSGTAEGEDIFAEGVPSDKAPVAKSPGHQRERSQASRAALTTAESRESSRPPSRGSAKDTRTVRSGSMVETTVDRNGVKKMIINISGSDDGEEIAQTAHAKSSASLVPERGNGEGEASHESKNKKKKKKKKKNHGGSSGGNADETTSLLKK
jgi:metal transporter CNNM